MDELTKAILFMEGLKVELHRAVKQAQAETLQTAVRAACAAAECEPELIEQDDSPSSLLYASESDVGKNSRGPPYVDCLRAWTSEYYPLFQLWTLGPHCSVLLGKRVV